MLSGDSGSIKFDGVASAGCPDGGRTLEPSQRDRVGKFQKRNFVEDDSGIIFSIRIPELKAI